jgi:hypothetical protein
MVRYCSDACELEDVEKHRGICEKIRSLAKSADAAKNSFNSSRVDLLPTDEGVLQIYRFHMRHYMRARLELANRMYTMAHSVDSVEAWEIVEDNFQEALRLPSSWHLPTVVSYHFPYVLLTQNRDDDAYAYCSFWLKTDEKRRAELAALTSDSSEGEYIYTGRDGCRHLDIFEECPDLNSEEDCVTLLVAVAVIKMRLVAFYESYKRSMSLLRGNHEARNRMLAPVASLISEMLVGCDENTFAANMESQRGQLDRLLDHIEKRNADVIKTLLNPLSYISQARLNPWAYTLHASPEDHQSPLLYHGGQLWGRIPGAMLLLEKRLAAQHMI